MAHPTGFEPVASAFGGIIAGSANKRQEPPMTPYRPVIAKEFDFGFRRKYALPRHSFRPLAYVMLTRESAVGWEKAHV